MSEKLQVFLNQKHLGEISLDGSIDSYGLSYAPSWLAEGGFLISPHLKPAECSPESVRRFLANLLPEGKWLEELSLNAQVSRSNTFGLIAAIGGRNNRGFDLPFRRGLRGTDFHQLQAGNG